MWLILEVLFFGWFLEIINFERKFEFGLLLMGDQVSKDMN
jgi:hypothetical protein